MTSNDLLKADVLDILFENRNKQYGAYALRKQYHNRLALALAAGLAGVLLMAFLFRPSGRQRLVAELPPDIVRLTAIDLPEQPPLAELVPPPAAPPQRVASVDYNPIEIVPDNLATDIPTIEDMANRQISSEDVEGVTPLDGAPSVPQPEEAGLPAAPAEPLQVPFDPLEQQPEFPGGQQAWAAFLNRYLRVPDELEPGERKTVHVRFFVGEDGRVTRFEVVQSAGEAFDQEVIRVLRKMPRWRPAVQNGHPTAVPFTQPVIFQAFEE